MFISKRKNGYYYIFYNDPDTGKRKSSSTNRKNKKDALEFLQKFNVENIPTILLLKGGKVVKQIDGTISRGNLKSLVMELLNHQSWVADRIVMNFKLLIKWITN